MIKACNAMFSVCLATFTLLRAIWHPHSHSSMGYSTLTFLFAPSSPLRPMLSLATRHRPPGLHFGSGPLYYVPAEPLPGRI